MISLKATGTWRTAVQTLVGECVVRSGTKNKILEWVKLNE
jgi:hypothetical protein